MIVKYALIAAYYSETYKMNPEKTLYIKFKIPKNDYINISSNILFEKPFNISKEELIKFVHQDKFFLPEELLSFKIYKWGFNLRSNILEISIELSLDNFCTSHTDIHINDIGLNAPLSISCNIEEVKMIKHSNEILKIRNAENTFIVQKMSSMGLEIIHSLSLLIDKEPEDHILLFIDVRGHLNMFINIEGNDIIFGSSVDFIINPEWEKMLKNIKNLDEEIKGEN